MLRCSGPSVILTYTGTVAYSGAPDRLSDTLADFFSILAECFDGPNVRDILLAMRVLKVPKWSVAVADIPH